MPYIMVIFFDQLNIAPKKPHIDEGDVTESKQKLQKTNIYLLFCVSTSIFSSFFLLHNTVDHIEDFNY